MNTINILVPDLPDSVSDAVIVKWHKKIGEIVYCDENIVDIETDKIMLEVSSPCNGILSVILEKKGSIVKSTQIIGSITESNDIEKKKINPIINKKITSTKKIPILNENKYDNSHINKHISNYLTPSARRFMKIHNIDETLITPNQFNHTFRKQDIHKIVEKSSNLNNIVNNTNNTYRVQMTRLRQKIAERLLATKNNTAMLTTFNEVNMQPIISLRKKYNTSFEKKYGVRIGFMSFFVKAVVEALKHFPEINATIDKQDIVFYKNFDISIAVSTPRGLITPVLRDADKMSMAHIEKKIKEFSIKSLNNKIKIEELIGGNFTITNGGVFGSLMSTPIINPPQTAILGMHAIKERPMAVDGEIKILPMMYLALSYDHCLIDGKESVSFLNKIKNILEDFNRILINI
ncbi:dihydrolipoyllysine-residue succinyltransferase [Buchnera aphidicola (Aphis helianthi)]|uniref:Dihydrolipoyllysine-residue succinyltransferase n=1 Tax=Buchnera aphidicola (Aphis helianthi) TaxID=2315802 RepID=A0A4D6XKT1_9GAMM|nr:dihydrolipoyllysine-residue succinyltransferase [Buchnera aphidicola]QCI17123.1 dihydrolipoyllysine-residue succinyltransferase [Buchnera aphidicola (Aphis helianthi)]